MRRVVLSLALAAAFTSSAYAAERIGTAAACEREMVQAASRHGVPLSMLYAVGLTETGRGDSLRPFALNIDGAAIYDIGRAEAVRRFNEARAKGTKLIDVGCMQINHYYHAKQFRSLEHMLDPEANVDYAARFLADLKKREGSWTMAVARYHAGPDNDAAQKRYVCRVIRNMVATGFGGWTADAKAFCGP